jgi:hypothetical protein
MVQVGANWYCEYQLLIFLDSQSFSDVDQAHHVEFKFMNDFKHKNVSIAKIRTKIFLV